MTRSVFSRRQGCRLWLAPLILLVIESAVWGQGPTIVHQQFLTPDPNPWFPWDLQGQRVMGGPGVPVQWALDLDSDGQAEYRFVSADDAFQIVPSGENAVLAYTFGPGGMNAWALPLPSLTPITTDAGANTWFRRIDTQFGPIGSGLVAYAEMIGGIGSFLGIESAYVGLQFNLADGTHYGWARVGCPVTGLAGGWVYEAAYDTRPGEAILAGAVPEPSTWALLVAGGFLFWFCGRKKRKA